MNISTDIASYLGDTGILSDRLFSSQVQTQEQLEKMSKQALANGLALYQKKNYAAATKEFRRAIGIAPASAAAASAAEYTAAAYLSDGQKDKAVIAYRDAVKLNPMDDTLHLKFGHLLFDMDRYPDAEQEYRQATRINRSANNLFSLGEAQLKRGRYAEAESSFREVQRIAPNSANGSYGLGMLAKERGLFEEAIRHLQDAVKIRKDFYDGYAELGYLYTDQGQIEKAQEILDLLNKKAPDLADTLSRYMYRQEAPRFSFTWSDSSFPQKMRAGTKVAALDSYLQNAGSSEQFTMIFQFTKEMDLASVTNRFNWRIERSTNWAPGEYYNFGLPLPQTEVSIAPIPDNVVYDQKLLRATVTFTITQNETAEGTIDPAHIMFKFMGLDMFGNKMDTAADEYSSATGIA